MSGYWTTLRHNGVNFPPEHEPLGIKISLQGKVVPLTLLGEEMAYQLAKKKDTPYIKDPVFIHNFMKDFARELPDWARPSKFEELDLGGFFRRVDEEKAEKESMSREGKKALAASRKERRESLKSKFGKAMLDEKEVDIANWMVEPPGLFMGRGSHPLRGRWKPRVNPSDVTLNLGESAPVPPGHWKEVVHDHNSMWMAKWIDKLTEKEKYVWLHESSPLQQSRSKAKYDNALKVGTYLPKIRARIEKGLGSKDRVERQVATVCYLIDRLGMRVGDEKDEDEADTVGASTLRVEHVKMSPPRVEFDFLGKDSVPWKKSITPPESVIRNLVDFTRGKKPDSEVFSGVSSGMVNAFLSSTVKGASAKVFRTYHATVTTEEALRSRDVRAQDELNKVYHAKEANLKAAIFCNHQRTPPKTWEQSLFKKEEKLREARSKPKVDPERLKKLEMEIDFYRRTKNYNLNTSLKNYIDPRVYKAWCDSVGLEWSRVYSKSLQRKFSWVAQDRREWEKPVSISVRASDSPAANDSP